MDSRIWTIRYTAHFLLMMIFYEWLLVSCSESVVQMALFSLTRAEKATKLCWVLQWMIWSMLMLMSFFIFISSWCGHRARTQLLYSDADQRQQEWRTGTGMGLHSQHSFVLAFIKNKGEIGTIPADMLYTIIGLQPTAECGPMLTAKGEEWRLLQPTVLSLFSPPPAPPRPMCPAPPAATRGMGAHSAAESAQRGFWGGIKEKGRKSDLIQEYENDKMIMLLERMLPPAPPHSSPPCSLIRPELFRENSADKIV